MDKDEVLRKARAQKANQKDEMELDIFYKGSRLGVGTGLVACLLLMIAKMIADVPYYDLYVILCAIGGGKWLYKGIRLKNKGDICYGIVWYVVAVGFFLGYLGEIF